MAHAAAMVAVPRVRCAAINSAVNTRRAASKPRVKTRRVANPVFAESNLAAIKPHVAISSRSTITDSAITHGARMRHHAAQAGRNTRASARSAPSVHGAR